MPLLISYCDINIKQVGHDTGAAWRYKNEDKKNGDLDVEAELDGRDKSES